MGIVFGAAVGTGSGARRERVDGEWGSESVEEEWWGGEVGSDSGQWAVAVPMACGRLFKMPRPSMVNDQRWYAASDTNIGSPRPVNFFS